MAWCLAVEKDGKIPTAAATDFVPRRRDFAAAPRVFKLLLFNRQES